MMFSKGKLLLTQISTAKRGLAGTRMMPFARPAQTMTFNKNMAAFSTNNRNNQNGNNNNVSVIN